MSKFAMGMVGPVPMLWRISETRGRVGERSGFGSTWGWSNNGGRSGTRALMRIKEPLSRGGRAGWKISKGSAGRGSSSRSWLFRLL